MTLPRERADILLARVSRTGAAVATVALGIIAVLAPAPALAVTPGPQWTVTAISEPTNLPPGQAGSYIVEVKNTGGAPSDGSPIVVADALPNGLALSAQASGEEYVGGNAMSCTGLTCSYAGVIAPGDFLAVTVPVTAASSGFPPSVTNVVTVSGGGAQQATRETPTTISSESAPFGIAPGSTAAALSTTQAGAHADFTAGFAVNTDIHRLLSGAVRESGLDLPPGFVVDLADTPRCSSAAFSREEGLLFPEATCDADTQVGTVSLRVNMAAFYGYPTFVQAVYPVYNLSPNPGEIARLGFWSVAFGTQGTISVRPGDYGGRTTFKTVRFNVLAGVSLTVWGVPADPIHDEMRALQCSGAHQCGDSTPTEPRSAATSLRSSSPPTPYFTNATQCSEPLGGTFFASSWQEPERQVTAPASFGSMTGCGLLEFGPYILAAPDTSHADSPAGFSFDVKMPQEGLVGAGGLSSSDIENTTATLPDGVVINPGQAAGLGACQPSQDGVGVDGPPACPSNSRVGEVEVETPLIKRILRGAVYVLASNPPNIKLLVAPEDPADGLYIKFVGTVHMDERTGRLVTTFERTPALPFGNLRLSFSGGAQAALVTPSSCGVYASSAGFAPWSGEAEALTGSSFAIDAGPGGSACAAPLPFDPSMIAGSTTDRAGAFTDFSLLLQRGDGRQRIEKLQFKAPAGLSAMIAQVPLCQEPEAAQGTCPAASRIGHAVVTSGPGPYPLVLPQPGAPELPIYLTGPYKGAPFGLSIVTPVIAGPFNLGTIVTRASIAVDPATAQITVTTDPLPQIVKGVPTDLRSINSVIDRPGFMFNPTNCSPAQFTGTATSAGGAAAAPLSSHFGVGSCRELGFHPKLAVTTAAKSSKASGSSLSFRIAYPKGAVGRESWFSEAKFVLPKQLPARLTTLQKACLASVFEANPASCPSASVIGHAVVHTPVLPVPLAGPVYFVSHGGAKFPDAVLLLQGYGVTVELVGETFIDGKTGITSATFRNTPDVPFESIEVTVPSGPFSEFGANLPASAKGSFCGQRLVMPTFFKAQNGLEIRQNTAVGVNGCKKTKSASSSHKLHAALAACHRAHHRAGRARCEERARKRYGR
jgi:uncharacterized repeat protein (TIGR01451 family)